VKLPENNGKFLWRAWMFGSEQAVGAGVSSPQGLILKERAHQASHHRQQVRLLTHQILSEYVSSERM
jgi:hypothetical protein